MNLQLDNRLSTNELLQKQKEAEATPTPEPTVTITETEWLKLSSAVSDMTRLADEMKHERKRMQTLGDEYLTEMKKLGEEQQKALTKALTEQEKNTKGTIRRMETAYTEQAGRVSERASRSISRRILTDDALWGVRLLLTALPTLLVLALSVYMGWLPLFQ